jgi:hypothetical protein
MKKVPMRRTVVVILLLRSAALTAQLATAPTKVAGADYDALVKRGVPVVIATLMGATTEIVSRDDRQIHFVQSFPGGAKRDVILTVTPAENRGIKRPLQLPGGDVILAERTSIRVTKNGYAATMTYFIPASALGDKTGNDDSDGKTGGPFVAAEGQPAMGASVTLSDVGTSASGSPSLVTQVSEFLNTRTGSNLVTAGTAINDVIDLVTAPEVNPGAPTTLGGKLKSGAGNLVTIGKQGFNVWSIGKKHWTMKDRLRALRKCAENPTSPTAKRAQREDPRYREATTDVIDRAERDLDINSGLEVVATTANGVMSALLSSPGVPLGSQLSKAVGIIDDVEQKILNDVAEAYIMRDAGKGVVNCDCDPVFEPAPPTEEMASYPPAELSCNPSPEELVCRAAPAPASSSQPAAPTPPRQPVAACVPPTQADFTWRKTTVTSGCSAISCGFRSEEAFYAGSAALRARPDGKGYEGNGTGRYGEATHEEGELRLPVPCRTSVRDQTSSGPGALKVNAMFSINNTVTGGLDTGGMPENTTVVEILTHGNGLHDEEHKRDCDGEKSESIDNQVMGFDCHFYGVPLDRPGVYFTYKDRDAHSGVCMLILR